MGSYIGCSKIEPSSPQPWFLSNVILELSTFRTPFGHSDPSASSFDRFTRPPAVGQALNTCARPRFGSRPSTGRREGGNPEALGDWSESNWGSVDLKVKNNPLGEVGESTWMFWTRSMKVQTTLFYSNYMLL